MLNREKDSEQTLVRSCDVMLTGINSNVDRMFPLWDSSGGEAGFLDR